MSYLLVKSLHVCAIIVWIAGMVLQALALQLRRALSAPARPPHLASSNTGVQTLLLLQRWDRLATAQAMLLAWITGLLLATLGGWFGQGWLFVKLAIVIALSATHGMLAGRLRAHLESHTTRMDPATMRGPLLSRPLLLALFLMTAGIVLLVISKPF